MFYRPTSDESYLITKNCRMNGSPKAYVAIKNASQLNAGAPLSHRIAGPSSLGTKIFLKSDYLGTNHRVLVQLLCFYDPVQDQFIFEAGTAAPTSSAYGTELWDVADPQSFSPDHLNDSASPGSILLWSLAWTINIGTVSDVTFPRDTWLVVPVPYGITHGYFYKWNTPPTLLVNYYFPEGEDPIVRVRVVNTDENVLATPEVPATHYAFRGCTSYAAYSIGGSSGGTDLTMVAQAINTVGTEANSAVRNVVGTETEAIASEISERYTSI